MTLELGPEIITEWYDGPLRSIRLATFSGMGEPHTLVQVDTSIADVGPLVPQGYTHGREVMVRFAREELQAMLDLLDGKPVKGFFDEG